MVFSSIKTKVHDSLQFFILGFGNWQTRRVEVKAEAYLDFAGAGAVAGAAGVDAAVGGRGGHRHAHVAEDTPYKS